MMSLFSTLAQAIQPATEAAAPAESAVEAPLTITRDGTGFWLPPQAGSFAAETDWAYWFIFWISAIFTVLIIGALIYFCWRFRHREGGPEHGTGAGHSTTLEITWTLVPLVLVLMFFYYGYIGFLNQTTFPPNAYYVTVTAQKWSWSFQYPNGGISNQLRIPINTPVVLTMQSSDVIHSLFIPQFRVKKDVVPGRYNKMWFEATQAGTFDIFCAEYCGTSHSDMLTYCVVEDDEEAYQQWLTELKNPRIGHTPIEWGAKLYEQRGCVTCHSIDGTANTGPTWKDLWMAERVFVDGTTAVADENYIRESILYPSEHVVKGFGNNMSSYLGRLSDNNDIPAIIAYIRSISGVPLEENYQTFEQADQESPFAPQNQ